MHGLRGLRLWVEAIIRFGGQGLGRRTSKPNTTSNLPLRLPVGAIRFEGGVTISALLGLGALTGSSIPKRKP